MNESKCLEEEWMEIDDAGGRLRGATDGSRERGETGTRGCCNVDNADKNRLTCFLIVSELDDLSHDLLFMQISATSLIYLAIPKVPFA